MDFETTFGKIFLFLIIALIASVILSGIIISIDKSRNKRKEWNDKVKNCVLNENYRNDCKLILYKDQQIHSSQNTSTVVPVPIIISR